MSWVLGELEEIRQEALLGGSMDPDPAEPSELHVNVRRPFHPRPTLVVCPMS